MKLKAFIDSASPKLLEFVDYVRKDLAAPQQVRRNTALILACAEGLENVAIKLIDAFGDKCKPEQVSNNGNITESPYATAAAVETKTKA